MAYIFGSRVQCAAVKIHLSLIRVPPQVELYVSNDANSLTCHGHAPRTASSRPPTFWGATLVILGDRIPHAAATYSTYNGFSCSAQALVAVG
jgi:hypothetical protein